MMPILIGVIAYIIGTIPFSLIIGKMTKNLDVRDYGSGNAGATNVVRVMGFGYGVVTFLGDFLKGVVSVLLGLHLYGNVGGAIGAVMVVVGHDFPFYLNFKGGKGVSTTLGSYAVLSTLGTLITVVIAFGIGFSKRYVSLGSILMFILLPISVLLLERDLSHPYFIASVLIGILGIYQHRANIKRLSEGTENKIGGKSWKK